LSATPCGTPRPSRQVRWLEDALDFEQLVAKDYKLATAVERLSHERAIKNLSSGGVIHRDGPESRPAILITVARIARLKKNFTAAEMLRADEG
jgi:hypothetical protein